MTWRFVEYYYERLVNFLKIECVDDTFDMNTREGKSNSIKFSDK